MPSALTPVFAGIRKVHSFDELRSTPLADGVHALCWERSLAGDFAELVRLLGPGRGVVPLDDSHLDALPATARGQLAIEALRTDRRRLEALGLAPELDCVHEYARDETSAPVRTDVFSFHVDRAPVETDTWLCTYHGPATEGLRHEDAQRRVDDATVRARLLDRYGGQDDDAFAAWLREHSFDLHYDAAPDARPFSFGVGNLWRIATAWPGSPVPPCIHRAPASRPGQTPRLLLIA